MKRLALLFSIILFLVACTQKKPAGIIENKKMIAVLTDVHLVGAYISMIPYDDTLLKQQSSKYYDVVFKKYKTSRREFDNSLSFYSKQPVVLDNMYNQVQANLTKKEKELSKVQQKRK